MRQPVQVLVIPFRKTTAGGFEFAAFKCSDSGDWQFIAGGAEDDESPDQAAMREVVEEAGLRGALKLIALQSHATVPVTAFPGHAARWIASGIFVCPEHAFGLETTSGDIAISKEHTEFRWGPHDEIAPLLKWDSNRNALWELACRLECEERSGGSRKLR